MNSAKEITLRELASQYYHELISYEDYRQRRTHLLDRLEQTTEASVNGEDTQLRIRFHDASSNPDRGTKKTKGTVYTLILVVTIIMGITAMILNLSTDGKRPAADVVPETPGVTQGQTENPESLVAQFLNANEWSVESIAGFTKTWEQYSPAERQTAMMSHWFNAFQGRLTERLRMEESRSDRSAGGGISNEALLLRAFARNLGLSLQAGAPEKTGSETP